MVELDQTSMPQFKRCGHCKIEKPYSEFYKNKSRRDGLHSECKTCSKEEEQKEGRKKERNKRYHQSENGKAVSKRYKQSEKGKAIDKAYRESHKLQRKFRDFEYYQRPEVKERRKLYRQTERVKTKAKLYRQTERAQILKIRNDYRDYWKHRDERIKKVRLYLLQNYDAICIRRRELYHQHQDEYGYYGSDIAGILYCGRFFKALETAPIVEVKA